jgi:hypothetical protein
MTGSAGSPTMTERRGQAADPASESVGSDRRPAASGPISRRDILRGASATVPTILTLGSGAAQAASSLWITSSNTNEPAGESYACLETDGQPGPRYYYDSGADVALISAEKWFAKKSELAAQVRPEHWTNATKVNQVLSQPLFPKYRGDQLCADGQIYIELASQTSCYSSGGTAVLKEVSLGYPGAMLSASAMSSLAASGKMSISQSI